MYTAEISEWTSVYILIARIVLYILLIALAVSDYRSRRVSMWIVMLTAVMSTIYLLSRTLLGDENLMEHLINLLPGLFLCVYSHLKPEKAGKADGLILISIAEITDPLAFLMTMAVAAFFTLIIAAKSVNKGVELPFITILVGAHLLCGGY